jgi:hypothetical protein
MGCGPEEGIDGRPVTILFGAPGQPSLTIAEMQVTIRRGYVNPAGLDRLATDGMASRQWTGPAQNTWQGAGNGSGEVDHDKNGTGKVWRETSHKLSDRFDASGGAADHHDIPPCHLRSDAEY